MNFSARVAVIIVVGVLCIAGVHHYFPKAHPSVCGFPRATIIDISLKTHTLVYDNKTYPVACGVLDSHGVTITPPGKFKVIAKYKDPIYIGASGKKIADEYFRDKNNAYGTRIIVLDYLRNGRHLSIHGTNEEDLIGQDVSRMCVRMLNADIEYLYGFIFVGDAVVVRRK